MKITGLLGRNKITIRTTKVSLTTTFSIPWAIPTGQEAAVATIDGRRPSPEA